MPVLESQVKQILIRIDVVLESQVEQILIRIEVVDL